MIVLIRKLTALDMLANPLVALGLALGLGVLNQFLGIFLCFYREIRQGNVLAAISDGVAWLVTLSGLLLFALSGALFPDSPAAGTIALVLFFVGVVTLVLTQGRDEKTFVGKAVTGVVSLYGIIGAYGITAFIGDVLSYSRLLALGLTTGIVGMAFNIIAGLVVDIPYFGWILFFMVVIFGHIFNFFMSILSAFVHSARLQLLEFFNRFYKGGGKPFKPYGFKNDKIEVVTNP